jgi:hypothetical protein
MPARSPSIGLTTTGPASYPASMANLLTACCEAVTAGLVGTHLA